MKSSNLLLLLLLWQLTTITHAQDTSYVRPWSLESLQMPEQVRMQSNAKQGIPSYLQNHTFADTIVDTTEWEGLEDIEIVYAQALGTSSAYYSLDIELLDDGGFLVPWYDYDDGYFHITRLDSMANEVYTNHYENISKAKLDLYRDGKYVYMAGRVNLDSLEPQYSHVALIKYDLQTNDTVFFNIIRPCEYATMGPPVTYLDGDSLFYIIPTQHDNSPYIYMVAKEGLIIDSIENQDRINALFFNTQIKAVAENGNIYSIESNQMDSVNSLGDLFITNMYYDGASLFFINNYNEILKHNNLFENIFVSMAVEPGFAEWSGLSNMDKENNGCLLLTPGVDSYDWWPPDEDYSFGLIKLHPNGSWLHKLYLGGANYYDQRVFVLPSGDYLLLASADQNPMGEGGTIFFTRIKPWDDGVGITSDPVTGQLNVYPNPAHDAVHVKLKKPENGVLTIHDISGKLVQQNNVSVADFPRKLINISNLQQGMYIMQLQTSTTMKSTRIIKN